MKEISPYYRIKCLFGGESGVGKSSIVHLTIHDTHDETGEATIGMAFAINKAELKEYPLSNPSKLPIFYHKMKTDIIPNGENFQLINSHIWDCAGDIRYRSILPAYLRDVDIAFLVFDISKRESWNKLTEWKEKIEEHSKDKDYPLFVIIASKSDLKPFAVSVEEIEERAKLWKAEKYIISCVQDNSSGMIKRMMYNCFLKFHEKIIKKQYEGEYLPDHLFYKKYEKENPLIKINTLQQDNTKYCCFQ